MLLALHSVRRHRWVFALVALTVVALSGVLLAVLPRTYEVQTTLQVQRADVIAALSGGTVPGQPDVPTARAADTILSSDNLVALVTQSGMLERWPKTRAPILRLKDRIWARLFPKPTDEDRIDGFVGFLERAMWVNTTESTVSIGVHAPDPDLAFRLVESASENFIEARHAAEISAIADAIAILDKRAGKVREELDRALAQLDEKRTERSARLGNRVRSRPQPQLVVRAPSEEGARLTVQIEAKRRAIADLEEFRRKRILELETRLQELRGLYADGHPAVQDLKQSIEGLRGRSPLVISLERDLGDLEAERKQRGLLAEVPLGSSRAKDASVTAAALEVDDPREVEDPDVEYAKTQVRHVITRYNNLLDRVEAARLEQDSAQAAYKYRYSVLRPAQHPRGPIKPKPALVLPSSIVAGLLLALLATTLLDLGSRRLLEPWQVETVLGIPLMGEIQDL